MAVAEVFQILLLFEGSDKSEIHEWIGKMGFPWYLYRMDYASPIQVGCKPRN